MTFLEARMGLAGKAAAVVGGAGGIGRATTLTLAAAGVDVAFCDIDETALNETSDAVRALGRTPVAVLADAREADAMVRFFKEMDRHLDRLDILVNVFGSSTHGEFATTDEAQWDIDVRDNFTYVLPVIREALTRIRRHGQGGSIVNLTTIEAHRGAPGFAVYSGAKAGMTNFSRALAVELAPEGIRVNTVAPDLTETERLLANMRSFHGGSEERLNLVREASSKTFIPMKRVGQPDDVANAILFLVSDLSSYITGTTLHPDGGTYAAMGWIAWPDEPHFWPVPPVSAIERLFGATS